jgi:hypothetical protein
MSTLNASTVDILNTIRANASSAYQNQVPEITKATEIPVVGDVLFGYPALANEFISALVNRIALVRVNSVTFNNEYAELKKGFLQMGETVEEVFINLTKAREFSPEKAAARELKRSLPDVRSAFHAINWKVQYPMTIQYEDLRQAFTSPDGVTDLIAKLVASLNRSAEYDEYLLFKYLMIKAVTNGKMAVVELTAGNNKDAAAKFRGISNKLTFVSPSYNASGVHTNSPRDDQYLFMDSTYNGEFDVDVLAAAFHMERADFLGHLKLVDDWSTFDNARFDVIRANCDMIEEVTPAELALMAHVKAVLVDKEWFQVYDNLATMSEANIASGLYWNYFYNVWKTVSSSPFSNAIAFVEGGDGVTTGLPTTITAEIASKDVNENATVFTIEANSDGATMEPHNLRFVQTEALTKAGIAVHPYGAVIIPASQAATKITLVGKIGDKTYTGQTTIDSSSAVGVTVTMQ